MSAFFFPEELRPGVQNGPEGFIAFSAGERRFYRRQEVDPLEFAALLGDANAKPSMLVTRENYPGIPEKNFCRYYREDTTDFIAGTVKESPFTYPGRDDVIRRWCRRK